MPPLAGLLAFEAVLRHGSMTLAGDELGLTLSAVSHRIRALEDLFGVALFERLNPGLRLTEAGARLAQELSPLLGTLAGMRRRIAGRSGQRTAAGLVAVAPPIRPLRCLPRPLRRRRDLGHSSRGRAHRSRSRPAMAAVR
jgi:DNA-binding transcriptional LysR family regulator